MALMKCSECGGLVSDKAFSCPHCGNPINVSANAKKAPQTTNRRVRKWRRLPNGYGQVRNLGGRRRKPYAVYPPVKEYRDNGTPVQQPALGYFETYQEALECLINYNKLPYDVSSRNLKFKNVFDLFFDDKFGSGKFSHQTEVSYRVAFKNMSPLHERVYSKLRTADFQKVIDDCALKYASKELMMITLKSMGKYANEHDIVEKDYAKFIKISESDDDEKGVPFNQKEIELMWSHSDEPDVQIMLILLYSGMRISELKTVNIDFDKGIMTGGVKTEAGKNRIIPIHEYIQDYLRDFNQVKFGVQAYRIRFYAKLEEWGIAYAENKARHTPHDLRHTFSWLADKYKMDSLSKHLILGHSLKAQEVEVSVYGHRDVDELKAEIAKIKRY